MAILSSETRKERVNLLLPSPFDAPDLRAALVSDAHAERREAIAEIEELESTYTPSNRDLARAICARLSGSDLGIASVEDARREPLLHLDELDEHIGPPESIAVFNSYTGVLTVAGPEGAQPEEAVKAIYDSVSDLVPNAELTASHRIFSAMDRTLKVEPEILDVPQAAPVWREAALTADHDEATPWGVLQVRAQKAWEFGAFGQGVTVAVLDTGIGPHVDLPLTRGFNFIPGAQSFYDDNGHGTHVAGTIAGHQANERGVVGIAPQVTLIAVKVLAADGFSRGDSVALGITWAANNGAQVINLSLGSRSPSESVNRAVLYAQSRHVVVCAAAGNDYGSSVSFPAAFRDICIAVAATDRNNRRAIFSNVGPEVDVAAPGVEILSTSLSNGYRTLNGTSMATPHVSGVAALVLSKYPALPPSAVRDQIQRTALRLGDPTQFGRGLIQADRAVAALLAHASQQPAGPVAAPAEGEVTATPAPPSRSKRSRHSGR